MLPVFQKSWSRWPIAHFESSERRMGVKEIMERRIKVFSEIIRLIGQETRSVKQKGR